MQRPLRLGVPDRVLNAGRDLRMHSPVTLGARKRARAHVAERKLRHDRALHQVPLGYAGCADRGGCGGLAVEANVWSCLSFCCRNPEKCDRVCRNNPDYAFRVQEIDGFELNLPAAPLLPAPTPPPVVPEIFHGSKPKRLFAPALASVSLYSMFDRKEASRNTARAASSATTSRSRPIRRCCSPRSSGTDRSKDGGSSGRLGGR